MTVRSLTAAEIDGFIIEDKIVTISCRSPHMPSLKGKFVQNPKAPNEYAFKPYKKGFNLPYLAPECWLVFDSEEGEEAGKALALIRKKSGSQPD